MTILFRIALICSVLTLAGCEMSGGEGLVGDEPEVWAEEALGPIKLANRTPLGLTSSSSTLYWTSVETDGLGRTVAVVWATTKTSSPGGEIAIHTKVGVPNEASFFQFEDITLPTAGVPYLYVVYNYSEDGFAGSYILKVGSAGGFVATIGASDYVHHGDVESDGISVFWSDPSSVFKVPVGGGAQTAFVQPGSPLLAQDASFLYYVHGLVIRRVRRTGGPFENVATASASVTAVYAQPASGAVFWGEQGGAVRSVPSAGGPVTTYQGPTAGRVVTSVGSGSSRVLWIDCLSNGTSCAVRVFQGGATTVVAAGASNAGHLQWDATSMFWGQDGGLMKYVH